MPMAAAAPGAQGESEGGIEAQQVVVGVAEEVQQHLWAQVGRVQGPDWEVVHSCPTPTLEVPTSFLCLSPPISVPVSGLMPCPSCCLSLPPWVHLPPLPHTALRSCSHIHTAQPHQPCPRKPQWVGAGCSHSDWQAGALGGSRRHTRTGSHTCTPCQGIGSPGGSGAGGSVLGGENRGARLRCGPFPHSSMQTTHKHQSLLCIMRRPKDESLWALPRSARWASGLIAQGGQGSGKE